MLRLFLFGTLFRALVQRPYLIFFMVLAVAPLSPQVLAENSPQGWSRFHRTVLQLRNTAAGEQAEFASAALAQLAEVYMAEADLARSQARREQVQGRAKLLSWSVAVDQYANQLLLLIDDIDAGYPVKVQAGREGTATVRIAGRAVMLGHPRPGQQAAFEQRVLADFCSRSDCKRMTADNVARLPVPVSAGRVSPEWSFNERGPLCSHAGIELYFGSASELAASRRICEELLQEAAALAAEISWQNRHDVVVDWPGLSMTATPRGPEHLVRLNSSGDSILLSMPLLFSSPGLLQDLKPWLRAQAAGTGDLTVQLNAASYGWDRAGK